MAAKWSKRIAAVGLLPLLASVAGRVLDLIPSALAGSLAAIGLVCFAGALPKRLLETVAPKPTCPEGVNDRLWGALTNKTDAGYAVGAAERFLILAAMWIQAPTLIAAWLAFKLASKWEAWRNVVQVPGDLAGTDGDKWFVARHDLGSWLLNRFWLGTLFNLLAALVAAYLGAVIGALPWWHLSAAYEPTTQPHVMAVAGLVVAAIGYLLSIWGSRRQATATPKAEHPSIARVGENRWVTTEEKVAFDKGHAEARVGQIVSTIGSALQLLGTILMGLAAFRE